MGFSKLPSLYAASIVAVFAFGSALTTAHASVLKFDFSTLTADGGGCGANNCAYGSNSESFTQGGMKIFATAYSSTYRTRVSQRTGSISSNESGLGVKSGWFNGSNYGSYLEIAANELLVLDLTKLVTKGYQISNVVLNSIQSGEQGTIYGSSTSLGPTSISPGGTIYWANNLPTLKTTLNGISSASESYTFSGSNMNDAYLAFQGGGTGGDKNVLVKSISFSKDPAVPEPNGLGMLAYGLVIMGLMGWRLRKSA